MKPCPNCGKENQPEATFCMDCGFDLVQTGQLPKDESVDIICSACQAINPATSLFCTQCGAKIVKEAEGGGKTMFFGAMQEKGKAKLVLVKGGGFEGVSYNLNSTDHLAGRAEGFILFPEDRYCSPKHANFFYFGGKFFVSDENSLNGVFYKLRTPVELKDGMLFRVGEQLFRANYNKEYQRLEGVEKHDDGTEFMGSPASGNPGFTITHILEDGRVGSVIHIETETFTIGRENCSLNYADDQFISGKHARITKSGGKYFLADNGSKNGTFYRITNEQELFHGDYVFIGQQLLRVEITQ